MMKTYLIAYAEIGLKGKNQPFFINKLFQNIQSRLSTFGNVRLKKTYGRLFVETDIPEKILDTILSRTFGISGFALVHSFQLSYNELEKGVIKLVEEEIKKNPDILTFKISAKRSNKLFPVSSQQINMDLGASILNHFPSLKVDVVSPEMNVKVEIREQGIYVYFSKTKGNGGLPVGCSGKGMLLLSGGIDSPVAGWAMLKRGMNVQPLHFFSPPYTSERAREKVIKLCRHLADWGGIPSLLLINFTEIQLAISKTRKKNLTTLLVRKCMMEMAETLCKDHQCQAVITGENLGQVASQTVESMTATSRNLKIPVFRPLIGLDKQEISSMAKKIDTYDTSILPYEDCCTLFLPENPKTRPKALEVEQEYRLLSLNDLIAEAMTKLETIDLFKN